jgi:hypothetical protein
MHHDPEEVKKRHAIDMLLSVVTGFCSIDYLTHEMNINIMHTTSVVPRSHTHHNRM